MTPDPEAAPSGPDAAPEATSTFGKRQIIATLVTLVTLVIVFAGVLPQLGDYDEAWAAIQAMSTADITGLVLATAVVILIYVWPMQAALPGLRYGRAFVVRQTSFLISNAIPAGGAIGLGVQYAMLGGYGIGPAPATGAISVTSVWNSLVTLGLPVLAVVGLVVTGHGQESAVAGAAAGLVLLALVLGLFTIVLRRESTAVRIGEACNRLVRWAAGLVRREVQVDIGEALLTFRASILDVVSERWALITVTNLLQQLSQFTVLWLAVVAVQGGTSQASWIQVFAAYSFARLLSFIPITPGGLGTVDAALTAFLQTAGVPEDEALAAVLVWRAATYFPQIFIGMVTFLVWRRRPSPDQSAVAAPPA